MHSKLYQYSLIIFDGKYKIWKSLQPHNNKKRALASYSNKMNYNFENELQY